MAAAASAVVSFATASAQLLSRLVLGRPSQLEVSRGGGSAYLGGLCRARAPPGVIREAPQAVESLARVVLDGA